MKLSNSGLGMLAGGVFLGFGFGWALKPVGDDELGSLLEELLSQDEEG